MITHYVEVLSSLYPGGTGPGIILIWWFAVFQGSSGGYPTIYPEDSQQ